MHIDCEVKYRPTDLMSRPNPGPEVLCWARIASLRGSCQAQGNAHIQEHWGERRLPGWVRCSAWCRALYMPKPEKMNWFRAIEIKILQHFKVRWSMGHS